MCVYVQRELRFCEDNRQPLATVKYFRHAISTPDRCYVSMLCNYVDVRNYKLFENPCRLNSEVPLFTLIETETESQWL